LTTISRHFQTPQTRRNQIQKIRSAGVSFNRLGAEHRKTQVVGARRGFQSQLARGFKQRGERTEHVEQVPLRSPKKQMKIDQLQ